MADDLTARRNQHTMQGAVCARATGLLPQEDLDEIDRFKGFLLAVGHLPFPGRGTAEQAAERKRIYLDHYPEETPITDDRTGDREAGR